LGRAIAVNVTIDAGSKNEAELIAAALPGEPDARSRRGFGLVRLRVTHEREAADLLTALAACVEQHSIGWARIRFGDQERTFKARSKRAS
jgi:hypothetical protein